MERYAGTEYSGKHYLLGKHIALHNGKRSGYLLLDVTHTSGDLISHNAAYALKIATKPQHIPLNIHVTQLGHILTDK